MENLADLASLPRAERRKLLREQEEKTRARQVVIRKLLKGGVVGLVAIILIFGLYAWWVNREVMPPTDIAGHIEKNPSSHIMDEPMPILIQKHMLEHADGVGKPGVVVNYNCKDFACEPDLIEKLKEIVSKYPDFVYLSPYPGMTKKIAITSLGKIATFDELDEEAIIRFIEER